MYGTFHTKVDAEKFAKYYRTKAIREKLKINKVTIKKI